MCRRLRPDSECRRLCSSRGELLDRRIERPVWIAARCTPKVNNNGSIKSLRAGKRFDHVDHAPATPALSHRGSAEPSGSVPHHKLPHPSRYRRLCDGIAHRDESVAGFERRSPLTIRASPAQAEYRCIRFQPVKPTISLDNERGLMTRIDVHQLLSGRIHTGRERVADAFSGAISQNIRFTSLKSSGNLTP